jgi:DNA repair protein REV1
MERYLRRVILEERDLSKVVGVVKWLSYLLREAQGDPIAEQGMGEWKRALEEIQGAIQDAVRERGLGLLNLD